MVKGSVFISYRRDDSEDITGRIHDHLERLIDRESLFRDVDNILPGVRFDTHINDALQNCGLVLAIIGPDWVTQRLSEPQDHLRLEIEFALRCDIPIIPVLVRGASIPTASQIPESIAKLVLYNGAVVRSDRGFKSSVKSLAKAILVHIAEPPTDTPLKKEIKMSTKQIHVFISHAWAHSGHYDTLSDWIFNGNWSVGQASLDLRDYSVPRNDPIHSANNDAQLRAALFDKISRSHVIVIPTGMYANYSKWIRKEIDGANSYGKPILAVNPWGAQRTSNVVGNAATKAVGWNKQTVIDGIWAMYQLA
jgi:hypothetical protein